MELLRAKLQEADYNLEEIKKWDELGTKAWATYRQVQKVIDIGAKEFDLQANAVQRKGGQGRYKTTHGETFTFRLAVLGWAVGFKQATFQSKLTFWLRVERLLAHVESQQLQGEPISIKAEKYYKVMKVWQRGGLDPTDPEAMVKFPSIRDLQSDIDKAMTVGVLYPNRMR
jgi:hypothetical protein